MCSVILAIGVSTAWPLMMAANRDEMLGRPWVGPGRHWPEQPDVVGGLDTLGGGTWLGVNDAGVVAAVLNRAGSLGPAAGKRSRGELPLLALRHGSARAAAHAVAGLDAALWRGFNLVVADRAGAFFLRGVGEGRIVPHALLAGVHMVTALDPDDMTSARVARHLPRFRENPLPCPPDWAGWPAMLADGEGPLEAALCVPATNGFGTVTSTLLALGETVEFLATAEPPGAARFSPVTF